MFERHYHWHLSSIRPRLSQKRGKRGRGARKLLNFCKVSTFLELIVFILGLTDNLPGSFSCPLQARSSPLREMLALGRDFVLLKRFWPLGEILALGRDFGPWERFWPSGEILALRRDFGPWERWIRRERVGRMVTQVRTVGSVQITINRH